MIGGYSKLARDMPLHDYQRYAVNWILERLFVRGMMGGAIWCDPGLGKTRIQLTVLDYLIHLGEVERALIVAPLRPIYTVWPAEIRRWGFQHSYAILHGNHRKAMAQDCTIELVNYEGLKLLSDIKSRWDMIILDESTFVKNWSTKRMRFLRKMLPTIPKRSILTGTPAANSLADLHSQMYVVDNGEALGKTVTWFRNQYMTRGGYQGRQWILRNDRKDDILEVIIDKALRMQAEDHLDMPQLVVNDVWCQMPPAAQKQYNKLKRDLAAELESGEIFCESQSSAYAKCKQFANGTVYRNEDDGTRSSHKAHDEKLHALLELFEELAGKPLLVFFYYTQDLHRIQQLAPFRKVPVIRGKDEHGRRVKPDQVEAILARWNQGAYPAILCQWQSASHGLNMQESCADVACFGLVDSLEVYEQAYRRVYRQGVKGSQVRIHRLLTENTVDKTISERLNGKYETQADFLRALKAHAKS